MLNIFRQKKKLNALSIVGLVPVLALLPWVVVHDVRFWPLEKTLRIGVVLQTCSRPWGHIVVELALVAGLHKLEVWRMQQLDIEVGTEPEVGTHTEFALAHLVYRLR